MVTPGAAQDPMMARIQDAIELSRAGDHPGARERFAGLWAELGPSGDPFHRCVVAHFAADVAQDLHDELAWDTAALAAADEVGDDRASEVTGFYPSLHGSLAEDHRKLGDLDRARAHLAAARERLPILADDDYGRHVRMLIERIGHDLDRS